MGIEAAEGLLACPVCAGALRLADRREACRRGHSFDVARQGYVNLLGAATPANADTPAMVAARERVLATGLFAPVAREVARRLRCARTIVETGAGTGYYLAAALGRRPDARGVALDISVAAARRSARAHPRAASVVADAWGRLPLLPSRFDGALCVFAPRHLAECARVLTPGGLLVVVTPTASHLEGLRDRYGLLGIDPDKDDRLARAASGHFVPIARAGADYRREAAAGTVADLIAMGPNAFHGVPDEVAPAEVRISVTVSLFRTPS